MQHDTNTNTLYPLWTIVTAEGEEETFICVGSG